MDRMEIILRCLVRRGHYSPPSWARNSHSVTNNFTLWEYRKAYMGVEFRNPVYQVRYWHSNGEFTVTKYREGKQRRIPKKMGELIVAKLGMES